MSIVRSAIAAAELTVAVVGIAVTVSRHPLFRAGVRAAPHVIPPVLRQSAADAVLEAAYRAGAAVRRVVPRSIVG
jgi:hypothetical protein